MKAIGQLLVTVLMFGGVIYTVFWLLRWLTR
jgi:hypothetical protein